MPAPISSADAAKRQASVLDAARWCFLNFGFAKTSLEDIAKRAGISRTLLYRTFKDKEDIFTAVFAHWLVTRHPEAVAAAKGEGSTLDRLIHVCRVMVVEPWSDLVSAPMGGEYFDVCARIDPKNEALHRKIALECIQAILGRRDESEVFLLALDGLLTDQPTITVLEKRLLLLAKIFALKNTQQTENG